jgi:hypothetical protein
MFCVLGDETSYVWDWAQPGNAPETDQGLRVLLHEKHCNKFCVQCNNEFSHMWNIEPAIEKLYGSEADVSLHHEPCSKFRFFVKRNQLHLEYLVMHWEAV